MNVPIRFVPPKSDMTRPRWCRGVTRRMYCIRESAHRPIPAPISSRATTSTEYGGERASAITAAAITARPATCPTHSEIRFSSRPEGQRPEHGAQRRHSDGQTDQREVFLAGLRVAHQVDHEQRQRGHQHAHADRAGEYLDIDARNQGFDGVQRARWIARTRMLKHSAPLECGQWHSQSLRRRVRCKPFASTSRADPTPCPTNPSTIRRRPPTRPWSVWKPSVSTSSTSTSAAGLYPLDPPFHPGHGRRRRC